MKMTMAVFACLVALGARFAAAEPPPRTNGARLVSHLQALSEFGKNPQGGVSRVAFTDADRAGHQYVMGLMRQAGLEVSIDAAGNIVGTRPGSDTLLRPIVIGSHIDSVPEGGNYDGDVGSLGAIEVAQVLHEQHLTLRHPLQVIVFADEEGTMVGSSAIGHGLDGARLDTVSQSGKTVRDGLVLLGGDPSRISETKRPPNSISAYIELHIEQGGVLERQHTQIGVVDGIVGILDSEVTIQGMANHAGTTPMDQRHDALLAAARFIEKFNELVTSTQGRQVGTVGWIKAQPGAYNVVPGKVALGIELRDLDAAKIQMLYDQARKAAEDIGRRNGTEFTFTLHDLAKPALTDTRLQAVIEKSAAALGLSTQHLPSGAGHDAQEMADIGPIGMIFIPSVGGISHAPTEYSLPGDIENGANVLLSAVLAADQAARLK